MEFHWAVVLAENIEISLLIRGGMAPIRAAEYVAALRASGTWSVSISNCLAVSQLVPHQAMFARSMIEAGPSS